jgi:hypothetical protein
MAYVNTTHMKITISSDVTLYSLANRHPSFGRTCSIHLQGRKSDFSLEDAGTRFLQNVNIYQSKWRHITG